jgi:15-cis-phytoene synthase
VTRESAAAATASLRELDRDRYIGSLALPAPQAPAIRALFAFAAEVAAIREKVREPMPGEIRLQWWKDALEGKGHGDVLSNPVADALLAAIEEFRLPTLPLVRLLEARRFDLYHDPMPDLPTLEGYAGETVSVLHQLAATMLDAGEAANAADAAGHFGVAQMLVGQLRAFGFNAAQSRLFLPLTIFAANGISENEIWSGVTSPGIIAARDQLCDLAAEHVAQAEAAAKGLARTLRPAFAGLALLRPQLALVRTAADPFALPPDIADWRKIAHVARRAWFG